jgi:RNAse (barnase) inhibitor barstar
MPVVRVPLDRISDRESFHTVFAEVLGFPQWYGRNLDAWIDCLTWVDEPESGLTKVVVEPGDVLTLEVKEFISRCLRSTGTSSSAPPS